MRKASHGLICAVALATTGCAQNEIRLEHARIVSDKADATGREIAAYYDSIEAMRRDTAATVVASDPSCPPATRFRAQMPRQERAGAPLAPLCYGREGPKLGYDTAVIDFDPTPQDIQRARAALIEAVVKYGVALAKILAEPKTDVEAELKDFAGKVDSVGSFLGLVGGGAVPALGPRIDGEKGQAILALVQFATDLAQEAHKVGSVRAIVAARGGVVDRALDILATDISVRRPAETEGLALDRMQALRNAYLAGRARMTFTERRDTARLIFDGEAEADEQAAQEARLALAITETKAAQDDLRLALQNSRNWTREMREDAAHRNLDRFAKALGLIGGLRGII